MTLRKQVVRLMMIGKRGDGKRGRRYLPPLLVLQTLFGQAAAAASYADTYENYLAPAQK